MKHLFIGGVYDGRRIELPDKKAVSIPVAHDFEAPQRKTNDLPAPESLVQLYVPLSFGGETELFTVYVVQGTTCDQIMAALVERYPPRSADGCCERCGAAAEHWRNIT